MTALMVIASAYQESDWELHYQQLLFFFLFLKTSTALKAPILKRLLGREGTEEWKLPT